jgi:hypothetical protein
MTGFIGFLSCIEMSFLQGGRPRGEFRNIELVDGDTGHHIG